MTHSTDRSDANGAPTREAMAKYWALVDEIAHGPRSEYRQSSKTREETLEILRAACREPHHLSADVDESKRRWR